MPPADRARRCTRAADARANSRPVACGRLGDTVIARDSDQRLPQSVEQPFGVVDHRQPPQRPEAVGLEAVGHVEQPSATDRGQDIPGGRAIVLAAAQRHGQSLIAAPEPLPYSPSVARFRLLTSVSISNISIAGIVFIGPNRSCSRRRSRRRRLSPCRQCRQTGPAHNAVRPGRRVRPAEAGPRASTSTGDNRLEHRGRDDLLAEFLGLARHAHGLPTTTISPPNRRVAADRIWPCPPRKQMLRSKPDNSESAARDLSTTRGQ